MSQRTNDISTGRDHGCVVLEERKTAVIEVHALPMGRQLPPEAMVRMLRMISPEEQGRARRYRRWQDQQRSALGSLLIRWGLGRRLGRSPASLTLYRDGRGRPRLADATQWAGDFNLSHSGEWIVMAITDQGQVGIDVERISEPDPGVAEICFTPEEKAALGASSGRAARELFYRLWTLKEAYVKALGIGLGEIELTQVGIDPGGLAENRPTLRYSRGEPISGWHFREFSLDPEHRLALCCSRLPLPDRPTVLNDWEFLV